MAKGCAANSVERLRSTETGGGDGDLGLAGSLAARITNHPTISHINMAATLDRRTSIEHLTHVPIYILRS
jgi:hypothetical protein